VRGKYAKAMQKGYSVRVLNEDGTVTVQNFIPKESAVLLDPDVKAYFPDSESVNRALRSLIDLIPEKRTRHVAEKRARYSGK
jgi:23S rRNA A2030 N6-methylase RlmJ